MTSFKNKIICAGDAIAALSISGNTILYTKTDGNTNTITLPIVTTTFDGLMSKTDKMVLDNLSTDDIGTKIKYW